MTPKPIAASLELADRVDAIDDITCPLCGETGFDVPGFVFSHESWCEVRKACLASNADRNSDVAAALRSRTNGDDV